MRDAIPIRRALAAVAVAAVVFLVALEAEAESATIFTLAGTGSHRCADRTSWPPGGLERPATLAQNLCPGFEAGVAVLPNGDVLADAHRGIVRIDRLGFVHAFAGADENGPTTDGGQALGARLRPESIAVDATGGVLVADSSEGPRIRRITPDGTIHTVAGRADFDGGQGDGGPATSARLNTPRSLAPLPNGGFAFVDGLEIRKVSADGTISTVVSQVDRLGDLAALPSGELAVVVGGRLRVIGPAGLRALGGYQSQSSGPCRRKPVSWRSATSVGEAPGADILVGWQRTSKRRVGTRCVFRERDGVSLVDRNGAERLVAGSNPTLQARADLFGRGDGGPASRAHLVLGKEALATTPEGSVVVSDGGSGFMRLRLITDLPGARPAVEILPSTLAGRGRVRLSFATATPAQLTATAGAHGREVARVTASVPAGHGQLLLPRKLPNGQNMISLKAVAPNGAVAGDRMAMLPNGWLPAPLARRIAQRLGRNTPTANAADAQDPTYSVLSCHRFARTRVDCIVQEDDCPYIDDCTFTARGYAVKLAASGRIYLRTYAVSYRKPHFVRKQRWRPGDVLRGPVFSDR